MVEIGPRLKRILRKAGYEYDRPPRATMRYGAILKRRRK